jgi:cytochrome P450
MVSLIKVEAEANSKTPAIINIDDWAGRVSLDIIGKAGFGQDFNSLSDPDSFLNTSYRTAFLPNANSRLYFVLALMTRPKLVNWIPSKINQQVQRGLASVTDFVRDLVSEKQKDWKNVAAAEQATPKDIITAAIKTDAFTTEQLVAQSKTLLGAGHETYVYFYIRFPLSNS